LGDIQGDRNNYTDQVTAPKEFFCSFLRALKQPPAPYDNYQDSSFDDVSYLELTEAEGDPLLQQRQEYDRRWEERKEQQEKELIQFQLYEKVLGHLSERKGTDDSSKWSVQGKVVETDDKTTKVDCVYKQVDRLHTQQEGRITETMDSAFKSTVPLENQEQVNAELDEVLMLGRLLQVFVSHFD
jgi:hypothetical protein